MPVSNSVAGLGVLILVDLLKQIWRKREEEVTQGTVPHYN